MNAQAVELLSLLKERYAGEIGGKEDPFKVLISCILSQRTREENTEIATKALFSVASSPQQILELPLTELESLIKRVGFARQKARRIKEVCRILIQKYGGQVPREREKLMELPGVGPKTADVTRCYGFGEPCIPVDTHVNRISKRLGLVRKGADVEEVQDTLKKIFRREDWMLLNRGMVLFGREICLPRNPKCHLCPIRSCPSRKG
jgi:endonuclease-3